MLRWTKEGGMVVVACGLHFPNGIQLSRDEKKLFVAELTRFRVLVADLAIIR